MKEDGLGDPFLRLRRGKEGEKAGRSSQLRESGGVGKNRRTPLKKAETVRRKGVNLASVSSRGKGRGDDELDDEPARNLPSVLYHCSTRKNRGHALLPISTQLRLTAQLLDIAPRSRLRNRQTNPLLPAENVGHDAGLESGRAVGVDGRGTLRGGENLARKGRTSREGKRRTIWRPPKRP